MKVTGPARLTFDPEIRYTPNGMAICTARLAYNTAYEKDEKWVEQSHFVDGEIWGNAAKRFVERFHKGDTVVVEDSNLKLDTWDDKSTGEKRSKLKITINKFDGPFRLVKNGNGVPKSDEPTVPTTSGLVGDAEDDESLPF